MASRFELAGSLALELGGPGPVALASTAMSWKVWTTFATHRRRQGQGSRAVADLLDHKQPKLPSVILPYFKAKAYVADNQQALF